MCFNWLRDRYAQEQLKYFCDKGINNNTDYFTKHHPPAHHQQIHPQFILKTHIVRKLFFFTESNFQNSNSERVCSWDKTGIMSFRIFRPFRENSVPRTFILGISLSDVMYMDYMKSRGRMLRDSIFRPVTDSFFRPRTSRGNVLTDIKSRTLTDRL